MASQRDGGISWTNPPGYQGETLNLARGCADPCDANCWAVRQAIRLAKPGEPYHGLVKSTPQGPRWTGKQRFVPELLEAPLHWEKPRCIAVGLTGDLFGDGIMAGEIASVYAMALATPHHRYCIVTKQAERRQRLLTDPAFAEIVEMRCHELSKRTGLSIPVSLPAHNVVELVSCSDQPTLDALLPDLLATPAAWRGLSLEPLLGPVELVRYVFDRERAIRDAMRGPAALNWDQADSVIADSLDWVIVGPETGTRPRPCDPQWIESIVAQCKDAGVACHVKALPVLDELPDGSFNERPFVSKLPSEWPLHLRVREWPEVPRG